METATKQYDMRFETGQEVGSRLGHIQECQKLIRKWMLDPKRSSLDVIPMLYGTLFGMSSKQGKDAGIKFSDVHRTADVWVIGTPQNFTVGHELVRPLMYQYTDKLDSMLRELPKSPFGNIEQIIHDAAFAYYVFERIHPFPDGNGRMGRMIIKRILKDTGLRDLLFHDRRWYAEQRLDHIYAMERVDNTGDLSHLELYLLQTLRNSYNGRGDRQILSEVDRVIKKKKAEIEGSIKKDPLSSIWEGFTNIPISGNQQV